MTDKSVRRGLVWLYLVHALVTGTFLLLWAFTSVSVATIVFGSLAFIAAAATVFVSLRAWRFRRWFQGAIEEVRYWREHGDAIKSQENPIND